jgi:phage shock protein E
MKNVFTILFLIVGLTAFSQTVKNVNAEEFDKMINKKKGVIIDLRTNDEIKNKGKIKGAIQIDFLSVDAELQIEKLEKNQTYFIYCAGGGRSSDCAEFMQKKGFKDVIHLEKGFDDWKRKGFAVEKKE